MQNNDLYYINYDLCYKNRPTEEDLQTENNIIKVRCSFPKTIKKGKYIISAVGPVTYDIMKEYEALQILRKPLASCAVTGRWEGTPFSLITTDDFIITREDEEFIQDYIHNKKVFNNTKYNRLIEMNQWGSFIYIGKHKKGVYKNWGDYAEDLNSLAIEEIMKKLYYFEENLERLKEDLELHAK